MRRRRVWMGTGLVVLVLLALVVVVSIFVDEPLRRSLQNRANQRLDGYSLRIGALDFHPLGFSIDFGDLVVVQDAHPDPPVAQFRRLSASVHWRALAHGRLVADFELDRPKLYVNRAHVEKEEEDDVPVTTRGWQDALQALYPLKINRVAIHEGEVTYVDEGPSRPLTLTRVNAVATNIRNILSPDRVYPSTVRAEAVVFDTGRLVMDGNADFLAVPIPGVLAEVSMHDVRLDAFRPLLQRHNLSVRKGTLTAKGDLEYGPRIKAAHLHEATVAGLDADFVHTAQTARQEKQKAKLATRAAERVANVPDVQIRIDALRVRGANLGFVNRAATPPYRVFMSDTDLDLENLSNHVTEGTARARVTGTFMGSGRTTASAAFRPEVNGPSFDVAVRIVDTDMTRMNDLLRAYGKFDVVSGLFSFFSELSVKDDVVTGYVKPLFRDLHAYDKRQDKEKSAFHKLYEKLVGGVARLLENRPRAEVATQATVSGPIEQPKARTGEVILKLVQNAFFKAILPGFEEQLGRLRRGGRPAVTGSGSASPRKG